MITEKGTLEGCKNSATGNLITMTSRFAYVTIKIMCDACVKHCLLLETLTTVNYMNSLHYYCNITCPITNICTTLYCCDICKTVRGAALSQENGANERDGTILVQSVCALINLFNQQEVYARSRVRILEENYIVRKNFRNTADSYIVIAAKIRKFVFSKALRIFAATNFVSYVRKSREVLFALQRAQSQISWMFYRLILLTCSGNE